MRTTRNGRVYRSESEWRGVIESFERSGRSEAEFCAAENLAPTSFAKWRRKLEGKSAARFVELPAAVTKRSELELMFPSGLVLRVGI